MPAEQIPTTQVPILKRVGELLQRYEVLFCDVWGVLHDGHRVYEHADSALNRFRHQGGTVILVSNAPRPADRVVEVLDEKGVSRTAWDDLVTSGDLAIAHTRARGFRRVFRIGPERDNSLFERIGAEVVDLPAAEAIVVTGLNDERRDTAEGYRPVLERALARRLPLVCANPDLAVHVGALLLPCAGAVAALYETMGGPVFWAGKPNPAAYAEALARAETIRKRPVDRRQILAVGDALRTDLAAAAGLGIDFLFVAGGLHRDEALSAGALEPRRLAALLADAPRGVLAAISALRW